MKSNMFKAGIEYVKADTLPVAASVSKFIIYQNSCSEKLWRINVKQSHLMGKLKISFEYHF